MPASPPPTTTPTAPAPGTAPAAPITTIPGFSGQIITRADAGYERARAVWNAMHDRRPQLVAVCCTREDVAAALAFGRAEGWPIAVRGGGHSMPGHSVCDEGIVIDLSGMRAVDVDASARRARVQGGALLGEVDRATQRHGLVVPAGVVSHTGVGGLTLGGGVGRLMRRFGLTIDSLLSAEVVTADGEILRASAGENPDLFWALRGGGGNFGVVTEFEFALHELSELLILATFHDLSDAPAVLARAQATIGAGAPDELLWTSFLRQAPPLPWVPAELVGRPGIMSLIEWSGEPGEGRRRLDALAGELGPRASELSTVAFLDIQTVTDEIFAHGKRTYIKAGFAAELTPELIERLCEQGSQVGSEFSQIEVLSLGGAIARVDSADTAYPHRDAVWLLNVPATWEDEADDAREMSWARATYEALEPHLTRGKYVNFMDGDEDPAADTPSRTWQRLCEVKGAYDPENVFRLNQNIPPKV
jgi:FAD/FMN-containing dehydrogenase